MNVIDHVRDMAAAGLHSNVRLLSSLLLTMSNNNSEMLSPSQKYQLLVYHADSLFHDKEYRNAVSKYTMALQQKKTLTKTSKVRPAMGNSAATPQNQSLPSEIEVKYKMADCYTMLKQDKDAIAILDGIPSRQRTPKINMMLANLYKKAGQERSAVTSYKEVLRQCPLALDAILGLLSLSVKGAEVASMTLNVIQSIPNLDWLSAWIKAYAFVHTGDNTRAINTICSLEKKSLLRDNVDLLGTLADLYFRVGDNKNAILKFEQAQMLDPYLIKGMDIYGYLLAREGRLEDVENLGCRLFNISDQHAEPWVVSGCHSFYTKRHSRALYLGAKAIQLNSNSVQALLLKGAALRNMGRVQEAIIHFREAIRLAPCRLDCCEGRELKYEEGIALLRNTLANQSDCVLHRMLGDFLVVVNEFQEAMDQYSIALSLDPNDQKSLEGMQKMEKEESPTDATQEEDVDDMEGSGEEGDLEGSDSEAAQWADQEPWFAMQ
ncbi:anaphase promoting complex subunit 7 S homeolog isoform X1 [Xenopus laevis]|uniref:Anaphase promoting complex subunit 7 S homeolog isoform X1 n=1 Tax=Xenopus laevis TaxID=8355 RepID=A0A8J1LSR9_XENLA|nr:anaphase promoting complex subunit 7 S homeolog isoform X1 [Xenopus laevis]